MDADLRRQMLEYYDERAPDYEQVYTLGTGSASIPDPHVFTTEASLLASIVQHFGSGRLIDLACGTAYWLPHYAPHCCHITLFDQSERMLQEARVKVDALGIAGRCTCLHADFFEYAFGHRVYDCALVGFFLSHLTETQESLLFDALRTMLSPSGRFLILDSAWSAERARFNPKTQRQRRRLNDGRTFEIYKRYCDRDDISAWMRTYDATLQIEHFGAAFYAVSGAFRKASRS
jgi:ubiquinone/menaquinone biosynthesis C-methylase UbiE